MAEFSTGVTTLLARMDTNPSEFFDGAYKWSFLNADWVKTILTEAEEAALNNKLTEVRRIAFDRMVMQTLLDSEAEGDLQGLPVRSAKGKITNMAHPSQMAQQGSSLMNSVYANVVNQQQIQNAAQSAYANAYAKETQNIYPSGGTK